MSQLTPSFLEKAQKLGEKSRFSELHKLCIESAIVASDYVPVLKRLKKSKVLYRAPFWHSDLPSLFLSNTLSSSFALEFLEDYFRSDRNCSQEFNLAIYKENSGLFKRAFKLFLAFQKPKFYASLEKMLGMHFELGAYLGELEYIKKIQSRLAEEETTCYELISTISVDKFLLGLTVYDQFFLRKELSSDLRTRSDYEVTLIEIIDDYLRWVSDKKPLHEPHFQQPIECSKELNLLIESLKVDKPLEDYEKIFRFIYQQYQIKQGKYIIERFLSGHLRFLDFYNNPGELCSTDEYKRFNKNDYKNSRVECFFANKAGAIDFLEHNSIKGRVLLSMEFFSFFGFMEYLNTSEPTLDLNKLSIYLNENSVSHNFKFGFRSIDNRHDEIKRITGWSNKQIHTFLSYLTFDIANPPKSYKHWINYPLIKCGNNLLWIGPIMLERDWKTILFNKIMYNDMPFIKKQIASKSIESAVAKIFENAGYKIGCNINYKSQGSIGEIDVVAIRDNDIYIVEVKSGVFDNSYSRANYIESVRLEYGAAAQLSKAVGYIKSDWNDFKALIKIERDIDHYNIIPLIVTTYFEGDSIIYNNDFLKISMIELDVILNNTKEYLYNIPFKIGDEEMKLPMNLLQDIHSGFNPNHKSRDIGKINFDIWDSKKECDAETFVRCITENRVWSDIEDEWRFDPVMVKLE